MLDVPRLIRLIRGLANQRVDSSDQGFFSDDEVKEFMQTHWGTLYKKMVKSREKYFVDSKEFLIDASTNVFELPVALYKILKLDYMLGGDPLQTIPLKEIDIRDENRYQNRTSYREGWFGYEYDDDNLPYRAYLWEGNKIAILPRNTSQGKYLLKYVPDTPLIDSEDIRIPKDFDNYIVYATAITIALPEEGDLKNLKEERAYWSSMIDEWMSDRTQKQARSIRRSVDYEGRRHDGHNRFWRDGV